MKKRNVILSPVKVLSAGIILLAAITAITPRTLGASCTAPPSGLVGWWPGEGNANDIIGGDNGTLEGGATFAPGEVGQGFRLDGTNGYVQIPDSAALKPTNVTVEAWVWLDPNVSPASNEQIIFKQNSWSYFFEGYTLVKVHLDNGNGTFTDRFQSVVSANGDQVAINSVTAVQRGVWYHVATTYDGNRLTLYVNGVAEASAVAGFPLDYGTEPVFIGTTGVPGNYINWFAGIIDEASIYSRALASNEIASIYTAGYAGKCASATANCVTPPAGLVGWWKGDGNTLDSFGGNNGVNQNVTYTNGVVGQAFAFDPENYSYGTYTGIQIADQPAYALTNSLTIEGWVRPRGNGYNIFWRGDNRPGTDPYFLGMSGSNINLWITDQNANTVTVGAPIPYFVWTHVAATLDGSSGNMSIYINGVLAAQTNTTIRPFGALIPGDSPGIGIGNVNDGQNNFPFIGDIDDISLYSRALAAGEIQTIYNAGSAGKCTGFVNTSLLLDIDFGGGGGRGYSLKTGFAAIGQATNDFWNFYDRDISSGNWRYSGSLTNLESANGSTTTVGMSVSDAPGAWGDASSDPMYATYIYPLDGGNNIVTFTNLSAGQYDVLAYSVDGNYEVTAGGTSYGVKTTYDSPVSSVPVWTEGVQYARWRNVPVGAGQPLVLTVRNGVGGYAILSGVQIVSSAYLSGAPSGVPAISSFTPMFGTAGSTVTVFGTNFSASASADIVYFGAVRANVLTTSPNSLTVTVPSGATYAPITVTVNGLTAYTDQPFTPTFAGTGQINNASLAPFVNLPTTNGPGQVVIADLDGDGKPDLIIPDSYAGVVSIYQNISTNGSLTAGSFGRRVDLPLLPTSGSSPYTLVAADLDGDGRLDLVVLNPDNDVVSVLRNMSSPGSLTTNSFAARIDLPGGTVMRGLVVQDLNGDGKPEIVTANSGDNTVSVFQNLSTVGNIAFAARVNFATDSTPQGLAVGDLDGDGNPDLVAVNWNSSTLSIFRNQGTGGNITTNSFAPEVSIPTVATPFPIAIGDLDGDGKLDLVVGGSENSSTISVYRNTSTVGSITANSFAAPVTFAAPGWVNSIALADLDGGGKLDIAFASQLSSVFSIFKNVSVPGSFTTASLAGRVDFAAGWNPNGVAIGDLDGDGRPDVVFANSYDNNIYIYQNVIAFGTAPVITLQPTNQTAFVGDTTSFGVTAGGTAPLSYQWNFNGTNIAGATNATLTLFNVQFTLAGNYAVLVTNIYGAAASSNAVLSVYTPVIPPAILSQTPNQVVLLGHTATFSVAASGSDPLSYFWQRNGVLISGATNASYTLYNAQLSDSGSKFSCLVTNAYGTASSTNVSLKVINSTVANDLCSGALVITNASNTNVQSTVQATSFGDPVPDCVDGFGHGVWYQFTAPVTGQLIVDTFGSDFDTGLAIYTGSCDALTEVACNDDTGGVTSQVILPTVNGTTYYILAGGYGSDAGNLVLHLNHLTPPAFAIQPTNESVVVSNTASFSATLTGALPMSFQWSFNGTPLADDGIHIAGSTSASLSISNLTTADAGSYTLAVTNFLGSTNSSAAVLTVLVPPVITMQPVGRSVPPGLPTVFTAAATGIPAPSYQWQLNGTNIPGAAGSSYTPGSNFGTYIGPGAVGTNDLGFYQVVVSNSVGVAVSASAQLTFGPVAAWGLNSSGECLPPPGLSNVIAIAGNRGASFAVRTDGAIIPWGSGNVTNIPASASNIVSISTSDGNPDFALRSDGTVVGWPNYTAPVLSNIVSIASGYGFAYGLRAEGTLTNFYVGKNVPLPAGLNHITAIACGYSSALALRSDGTVVIAGTDGTTNPPAGLTNVVAIAAGYSYEMALKSNGTVVAWGSGTGTNLPPGLTNIVAISAGNYFGENSGMAVRSDGTLLTWGDNNYGDKTPPAALSNLVSIAASAPAFHGLALVNNGGPVILHPPVGLTAYTSRSVTLQGSAVGAQPLSYQWLLNGTNVPGATSPSLVISNVQFGNAGNYQLFVSNSISTALSLVAPLNVISNHTLTFLSLPASQTNYQGSKVTLGATVLGSGPLNYQWYYSASNQIYTAVSGATSDTLVLDPALAANSGYYYVAVSNQIGGIISSQGNQIGGPQPPFVRVLFAKAWGYLPTDPPIIVTNATAIAVGTTVQSTSGNYFALKSDGKIASWSGIISPYGETNFATLSNSIVTAVAAGYSDSLVLKSDGTVAAFGYSPYGETNVPAGLSGVTAIACGDYHDLALKSDGTVAGWGQSIYQQTTNAATTNVVAIAAGGANSIALHADGSVVSWGQYGGQSSKPPTVTNVIAVAAGGTHFLALSANGTVAGWGGNTYGQITIPASWSNIVAIAAGANHSIALRNDGTVLKLGAYNSSTALFGPPSDLANVIAIAAGGDRDLALFGTRAPSFTVQPWNRAIPSTVTTNIILAAKCAGVQPVYYQWQLNGTNIPGATNDTLILTNRTNPYPPEVIRIPTGAYQLLASNAYGVVASKYAKVTTFIPLGTALNATNLNWTTSGNAPWFGETNITHDGVSAAQSGGIGALQETILQTTVATNWSGRYTFWWKVSSEQDFDILEFRINGIVQTSISGLVDWQQVSVPVATGTNVLMWRYSKDASFDFGQDTGWVDQFAFVPDPPLITVQPLPASQTVNMGANVTFHVTALGPQVFGQTPLGYQWRQNGNLIGGSGSYLYLNNVGRAQNGTYTVTVTSPSLPGLSAVSSNAVVKVLVPQLLGMPAMMPDGSFQMTSTDANGGLLQPSDLANFEAQTSTNLVNWATLPNALSLTNGMLLLQDSGSTNYAARYYRILEH